MNDANMPLRHGWLDLPHHEWQHGQPSGRTQPNPCGASNSHHHRPWVVTGPPEQTWLTRNRTFFAVISELLVVLGRNIAPPLLKLVISPLVGPGNRVWEYLYPVYFCISQLYFQNTQSLPDGPLPLSDSSLTFGLSETMQCGCSSC